MKRFPIFKPGKHSAMSGATLEFSEVMLKAAVAAYDPALHEAPITVGHPKDNLPAYGWVAALSFNEGTGEVEVDPQQLDASFSEMVEAGRFKKRSASWYLPDAPNNPKPGTLYLRHVAFLGAQPPAVKGLRDVSFADGEEGVVEFGDTSPWIWSSLGSAMRGLREWLIGEKGQETADKIIPNYLIDDLNREASKPIETLAPAASFSEHDMKPEELAALQAKAAKADQLEQENATLKASAAKVANFAERETNIAAREAKLARVEIEARVDGMIKAGKAVPAQKKAIVDFAMGLAAGEATVDFGEGDAAKKVTQRDAYLLSIETGPSVIDFGERSPAAGGSDGSETLEQIQKRIAGQVAAGGKTDK